MAIRFLRQADLPADSFSLDFVGEDHGADACVIFVDAGPGEGPKLHRHPYVEILIVLEGIATFDDGTATREVGAGEIAVVEANQPHAFRNSGQTRLRQIDIHLSRRFSTEWL